MRTSAAIARNVALALCAITTGVTTMASGIPHGDPKDWSDWRTHRDSVRHPAALLTAADLDRARRNIAAHEWARKARDRIVAGADLLAEQITLEWAETMLPATTAGCMGPCPACRELGKRWHPNGQWSWNPQRPEQLVCQACRTVFPNEKYPEEIAVRGTWDPAQSFTFIGGDTFVCFGYKQARPSPAGIVRARKVGHAASVLAALARAHALTGDAKYAQAARPIFLRLAEVFPKWLVRAGYGYNEYADCHPHVAAERIQNLPADELLCPPNKPDRRIHTGYWSASRVGTAGMDGGWVIKVALAYDLMCEATADGEPVFSPEERLRIEERVLLESTYLAACDTGINNKSVGNRAGAAIVGMVVGHPGLVRFGLDGFVRTVDEWFLPDGGTSESAAYAMMTMGGIRAFAEAFRDYTEPAGYAGPDGTRLERFNVCRDTNYGLCWQGMYWALQGNLRFPPLADSYRTSAIGSDFAELVALAYPTPPHLAFLKETTGAAPTGGAANTALFYRDTGALEQGLPPFALPDVVFPCLAQGYLRRGENGRSGVVVLNASNWGGHHHYDSLDLYLWQDGHELLSDLGYLWDHPDKNMTYRTFAHNLVLIDGKEQERKRGGSFHLFHGEGSIRFMEASSHPYPDAADYRRTVAQIDHGQAGAYVFDLFRAKGGKERQYLFHGPLPACETKGIALSPTETKLDLASPRSGPASAEWQATWTFPDASWFTAFAPPCPGETVTVGDGWGQRDHRNSDRGTTLPYILRARAGEQLDAFPTVFAWGPQDGRLVVGIDIVHNDGDTVVALVKTVLGGDVIVSMREPRRQTFAVGALEIETDARLAILRRQEGRTVAATFAEGTFLREGETVVRTPTACHAGILRATGGDASDSYFVLDTVPELTPGATTLLATGEDGIERAYPVRRTAVLDGALRLYTRTDGEGFPALPATTWRVPAVVSWQER